MLNRNLVTPLAAQAVGSGTNSLTSATVQVGGSILTVAVENTGTAALSAFGVQGKVLSSDLAFQTLVSGTNWVSTSPLVIQSTGLASTGSNTAGFAMIRVHGFTQIQFTAASATATTININPVFSEAT